MRSLSKLALAALALVGSGVTHADVVNGTNGNGQLVLFVKNQTTGNVYARGLDLFVDDLVTGPQIAADFYQVAAGGFGADKSFSFSLNTPIGPDANLQGFLNSTDTFQWTVLAQDTLGQYAPGERRQVFASNGPGAKSVGVTNASLNETVWDQLNAYLPDSGPINSTPINGQWDQAGTLGADMDTFWTSTPSGPIYINRNDLGSAANLYVMTGGGSNGSPAHLYQLGQLLLTADGTLQNSVAPVVPVPAAVWLLGSALLSFAGFARRGTLQPAVA